MEYYLVHKTVKELMEKFGAGNHKPGSGSAAAFQGMVSAKLISTVITLTNDKKRRHRYSDHLDDLLVFQRRIEIEIYPRLEYLFELDSKEFDKAIKLREKRDNEKDEIVRNQLRRQALEALKVCIKIPFDVAYLCQELADIGSYVFDNGFKAARGDSQVALSGAISSIVGCIAIIRLNVLSFDSYEYLYLKSITSKVEDLENSYKKLDLLSNNKIKILKEEYDAKLPLFEGINNLILKYRKQSKPNIEKCVTELQNLVWKQKATIWKKSIPNTELEILNPKKIFTEVLGFDFFSSGSYGVSSDEFGDIGVSGIIDQPSKLVAVSNKFSPEVQLFTAAHELGHAILHEQSILHRDLPFDSQGQRRVRDVTEYQADTFASFFLMPSKLLRKEFKEKYHLEKFELSEENAFRLGGRSLGNLKSEFKNKRQLSRKLASNEFFDGRNFVSLVKTFNVSIEAMAIQLENLGIVEYL